ncbi:MAG: hypothetical protein H7070_04775 [Saprospiraceae bacterium]|nr:hypothetical protein [Pyrinomonadaceae bacterium]
MSIRSNIPAGVGPGFRYDGSVGNAGAGSPILFVVTITRYCLTASL